MARLHRDTTWLVIEWLVETNANQKGSQSTLTRHPYLSGWTDGEYFVPTSYLHNENICRIVAQNGGKQHV